MKNATVKRELKSLKSLNSLSLLSVSKVDFSPNLSVLINNKNELKDKRTKDIAIRINPA